MNQQDTAQTVWISMELIDLPTYAREHSEEALASLTEDMKRNGQLQEIVVSHEGERYEVIAGVGRIKAAKQLGWEKIRADVTEGLTKGQKLVMTMSENNEREDASPIYTAMLYKLIMEAENLDQGRLAEKLGKDRTIVNRYLSLNDLAPEVIQSVHRCTLGLTHWLEIAKLLKAEDQIKLAQECEKEDWSVKELQKRVQKILSPHTASVTEATEDSKLAHTFAWKGNELAIKPLRFDPAVQPLEQYIAGLQTAVSEFLANNPAKVKPTKIVKEEVVAA